MPLKDDRWSNTGVPDNEALWCLVPRERLDEGSDDEGVNVVGAECAAEMTKAGVE